MLDFFEDKGDWSGYPIILQGVFEDGELIAFKALDATDRKPISWAFGMYAERAGDPSECFMRILQRLYDERQKKETS